MSRADRQEYIMFNEYWLWEYERRNDPGAFDRRIALYSRWTSFDIYGSASEIIKAVVSGGFSYKYYWSNTSPAVSSMHELCGRDENHDLEEDKIFESGTAEFLKRNGLGGNDTLKRAYVIDFSRPLSQILAEVKAAYSLETGTFGGDADNPVWTYGDEATEERLRGTVGIKRLPKREDRNLPRAIGLWLWDYLQERGFGMSQFAKAKNAFYATYQGVSCAVRIDGYGDEAQLRTLLLATDKCIHQLAVLPLC